MHITIKKWTASEPIASMSSNSSTRLQHSTRSRTSPPSLSDSTECWPRRGRAHSYRARAPHSGRGTRKSIPESPCRCCCCWWWWRSPVVWTRRSRSALRPRNSLRGPTARNAPPKRAHQCFFLSHFTKTKTIIFPQECKQLRNYV